MTRPQTLALIAATIACSAFASPPPMAPVAGGLSDRLAPLGTSLKADPTTFQTNLTTTLDQSRVQAHELIDRIVDEGNLPDFLEAMTREGQEEDSLARQLASADPEQARALLHSRVERQLASYGKSITQALASEDQSRLQASFDLALTDLTREENSLVDNLSEDDQSPSAPDDGQFSEQAEDSPSAPRSSWDRHDGRHDGRHDNGRRGHDNRRHDSRGNQLGNIGTQRPVVTTPVVRQTQRQVVQTQRQVVRTQVQVRQTQQQLAQTQNQLLRTQQQLARTQQQAMNQTLRVAQQNQIARAQVYQTAVAQQAAAERLRIQRQMAAQAQIQRAAWLATQSRASAWNDRCGSYATYSYRTNSVPNHHRFPTGYYYRPDRVEKVVKRGLWGLATVAATPFALIASVF